MVVLSKLAIRTFCWVKVMDTCGNWSKDAALIHRWHLKILPKIASKENCQMITVNNVYFERENVEYWPASMFFKQQRALSQANFLYFLFDFLAEQ